MPVQYKCNPSTLRAQAKYRNANKEKLKKARKAYYEANKEEILRKNREAYRKRRDALLAARATAAPQEESQTE